LTSNAEGSVVGGNGRDCASPSCASAARTCAPPCAVSVTSRPNSRARSLSSADNLLRDPCAFAHTGEPREFVGGGQVAADLTLARFERPPVDHAGRDFGQQRKAYGARAGIRGIGARERGAFLCPQPPEQVEVPTRGKIGGIGRPLGVYGDTGW
jgi:hypothetical protein